MSAREEILRRVRTALADVDGRQVVVPRDYRVPAPTDGLVDRFVDRVQDYRATVTRCHPASVDGALAEALSGCGRVLVPSGFPVPLARGVEDAGLSAVDLDEIDAVVTTATLGIAETGTIVLTHGDGQGRRALSLVPDLHVCLVRADQVVAGVGEAVALLDPRAPQTWISGPSATSDIELDRVEGVHGPRTLHVLLVEDGQPPGG
ncbi:LutC/YkgG family protein [Nocardioides donggukensis]|uniref:Lactate utilization protein C n=1 Tax=Nocardioides donggukensis TaxID=2774019 RepID=A0A927K545_9ACTN|nr:lactate utilization protein C [Nocardioides donggukensis]MBD8870424.1 lactate utilization protein C [Nocardioides donggukensis]